MRILRTLIKKELLQIVRDPSSIIIAFVLPFLSVMIYRYGINLDALKVTIGIKNDDPSPEVQTLVESFGHSKYVNAVLLESEAEIERSITHSEIKGAVIIPNDFSRRLAKAQPADLFVITDGTEVNTANYVQNYAAQIAERWLAASKYQSKLSTPILQTETRTWYNPNLDSRFFILPGSIAITMTLIGILLTSLVIAREWERGTMEAILSTAVKPIHIVLGKYIPYFMIGLVSLIFNVFLCTQIFKIPFRGSYGVLLVGSSLFLFCSLGIGLLISTLLKNQFLASLASLGIGFLPSLMLSGLIFPINSMPAFFQYLTMMLPPRYFLSFIESEFMTGTVPEIVLENAAFLLGLGILLFIAEKYENEAFIMSLASLWRIGALIKKEFITTWNDPKSRGIIVMMPLMQLLIFSNAATMEVQNIDVAVMDRDRSVESRELMSRFEHSPRFRKFYYVDNEAKLQQKIDTQQAQLGIYINDDFARSIKAKAPTKILVVADGRQTNVAGIASGYASQIIAGYGAEMIQHNGAKINAIVRHWYNPNIEYKWYILTIIVAMLSVVLTLILTALSVAREREMGTFDQLIVSPLSSLEILLGKVVVPVMVAMVLTCCMVGIIVGCFHVPLVGSLATLLVSIFVALLSVVGVGLFISSICRTQQQAILSVMTFMMPAMLLSGFISPVADMPKVLQIITYANPIRFFMVLVRGIFLKGMDWIGVLTNLIPLILIATLTLSLASWTFKRKLE